MAVEIWEQSTAQNAEEGRRSWHQIPDEPYLVEQTCGHLIEDVSSKMMYDLSYKH